VVKGMKKEHLCYICGEPHSTKKAAKDCEAGHEIKVRCFNPDTKQILCANHDVCLRIKLYGHKEQYVCMEHERFKRGAKPKYYTGTW
jgi:NAD(P)H-flavin reductase